jgi:hypothetical protein
MHPTVPNRRHASIGGGHAGMARSWVALANQMDRLDERDPANAADLALAR